MRNKNVLRNKVGVKIPLIHHINLRAIHFKVTGLLDRHIKRSAIYRFFSLITFRTHVPLIHLLIQAGFIVLGKGKNKPFHILWQIYGRFGKKKTAYRKTINNAKRTIYFTYIANFSVSSNFSVYNIYNNDISKS